jgi:hypothetical protein
MEDRRVSTTLMAWSKTKILPKITLDGSCRRGHSKNDRRNVRGCDQFIYVGNIGRLMQREILPKQKEEAPLIAIVRLKSNDIGPTCFLTSEAKLFEVLRT